MNNLDVKMYTPHGEILRGLEAGEEELLIAIRTDGSVVIEHLACAVFSADGTKVGKLVMNTSWPITIRLTNLIFTELFAHSTTGEQEGP